MYIARPAIHVFSFCLNSDPTFAARPTGKHGADFLAIPCVCANVDLPFSAMFQFASNNDARNEAVRKLENDGAIAFMRGNNLIPFS